ncbi:hypothetical protein [Dialister invisus]|uniref:hypothetical protein n=1 Tax=Dialister invisus TaxID=218538 RepID=UPI00307A12FF
MGEVQKRGLLYELKGGYRIDMTEEEYREKREELGRIAARLHVNLVSSTCWKKIIECV